MAVTRTRINGSANKQLVSTSARKLLGISPIITKADNPELLFESRDSRIRREKIGEHTYQHYIPHIVYVWDASSIGSAVGEPLLTATLAWEPGKAQGYIPVSYGLVIQSNLDCVVIWDT